MHAANNANNLFAVKRPVIIKIFDLDFLCILCQSLPEFSLGKFHEKSNDVLVEIFGVPLENTARIKGVPFQAIACRIIDEGFSHLRQLLIQYISLIRLRPERRAALGRTVDRKMNPGILETRAEDVVFDIIQGYDIPIDTSDFLFPWAFEQASQIFNGFDSRIGAQDQLDSPPPLS
jgi:hypothetical protein